MNYNNTNNMLSVKQKLTMFGLKVRLAVLQPVIAVKCEPSIR